MSLRPGGKVGGYEVLRALSSGGNAAVYVGFDPVLRREVALKILSGPQAHDPSQLERLRQEARVLAQLAHPNILQVIDLELFEDQPVLVTELLEGQTLRSRLTAGPLPALQALEVAMQVASALAAAHRQGVVHRDVKPENLFLTRDGHCKVLDFGLAKPLASGESSSLGEALHTTGGLLQGTVGYLSPEQIGGQPVDARADVYALGLVIHELVSGRPPGRGATAIERQISLLRDGPQPLPAEAGAPVGLDEVVARCLEVEPPDRFADAGQVLEALEEVRAGQGSSRGPRRWTLRRRWPVAAAALVAGLLGLGGGGWIASRPAPVPTFQRLTFQRGNVLRARFGPGGRSVIFGATWEGKAVEVYRADLDGGETRKLGLSNADVLAVSGNGELAVLLKDSYVLTTLGQGTLARVTPGGAPRVLQKDVSGADWDLAGRELAVTRRLATDAWVLEYPAGRELYRSSRPLAGPRFSPDGKRIAFMVASPPYSLAVVELDGETRVLMSGLQASDPLLAWLPGSREVVVAGEQAFGWMPPILAVGLDGRQRQLTRYPIRMLLQDVAADGRFLLEREVYRLELHLKDPVGADRDYSWLDGSLVAELDEARGRVLFTETCEAVGQRPEVYVRGLAGEAAVHLGAGVAQDLSPDGAWALALAPEARNALRLLPIGAGIPRDLELGSWTPMVATFRPGHEEALVVARGAAGQRRLLRVKLAGGAPLVLLEREAGTFVPGPDGRHVALTDPAGDLALLDLDTGTSRLLDRLRPGERPVGFDRAGGQLYVADVGAVPVQLTRIDLVSGARSLDRTLAPADLAGVTRIDTVRVGAEGTVAYTVVRVTMSDLVLADPPR
jgi:tRNA A-37 threonylcarbamoyl transferase component Bud32